MGHAGISTDEGATSPGAVRKRIFKEIEDTRMIERIEGTRAEAGGVMVLRYEDLYMEKDGGVTPFTDPSDKPFFVVGYAPVLLRMLPWDGYIYSAGTHDWKRPDGKVERVECYALTAEEAYLQLKTQYVLDDRFFLDWYGPINWWDRDEKIAR